MVNFSYSLSPQLKESLESIDKLLIKILLTPLSPKTELRMKWDSTLDRVYYSLLLSNEKISRKDIQSSLTASSIFRKPKKFTSQEKTILKYKKALDIITQNWIASKSIITPKTIIALHEVACPGTYKTGSSDLKQVLDYLQTDQDHFVVQAAFAYAAIESIHPFSDGNGRIARLVSLMFLYKAGFYARGLICFEENFYKNNDEFKHALKQGTENIYMTSWIEYFADSLSKSLSEKLSAVITASAGFERGKKFYFLNDRQKEILSILDEPNTTITNRKVQNHFGISQITASRDLARLAVLGLLAARGRGRSVYYTKV